MIDFEFTSLMRPLLTFLFVGIYVYAFIVGVSIFYHLRWFGMKNEIKGRLLELWFVAANLIVFGINVILLGSLYV